MRVPATLAAIALSLALASPAFAQMRMSTPAAPASPAGGADSLRPTSWQGLEEARVLGTNTAVYTVGAWGAALGMGGNLEGRLNTGLAVTGFTPFGLSFSPTASAKYLFMKSGNMSIAAMGSAGIRVNTSAATPFDLNFGAGVPISFWKLGPGDLHVIPGLAIPAVIAGGAFAAPAGFFGVSAGYIMPLNQKMNLAISDTVNGLGTNTLSVGSRIDFSNNMTLDIVPLNLVGGTFNLGTLTISGHFGASPAEMLKGIGL
jgi:hypothetical protein